MYQFKYYYVQRFTYGIWTVDPSSNVALPMHTSVSRKQHKVKLQFIIHFKASDHFDYYNIINKRYI